MEAKVTIRKHSIHKMLVVFPVGLFFVAVVFDVIYFLTQNILWSSAAFLMMGGGLVGGLLAAPIGWLDWKAIPAGTRAKKTGVTHGLGNLLVMVLFAASFVIRSAAISQTFMIFGYALSFLGIILLGVTAWLGGELVERMGVGVPSDVDLNADPNHKIRKVA